MSDNTPDFDNMSPEDIMAWMETLAKRQGASEGFTTAADMDIAEVDPDTVVIDEPGYIPYGQEERDRAAAKRQAAEGTPAEPAPPPAVVQRPTTPVTASTPLRSFPTMPAAQPPAPPAVQQPIQPAAQSAPARPVQPPQPVQPPAPPVDEGALAWLESLAADESEKLFNLDLSDLPEETALSEATQPINPMTWLEDLARSQVAEPSRENLGTGDDDLGES